MVSVHELFSTDIPDPEDIEVSLFANPDVLSGPGDEAALLVSYLAKHGHSRRTRTGAGNLLTKLSSPRPCLGHRPDIRDLDFSEIKASIDATTAARQRASRNLRNALLRKKANSRASTSTAVPSGRAWLESSCTNRSSEWEDFEVPAVFPFPEPIPHEIPSRRSPSRESKRSHTPTTCYSSRPGSRATGGGSTSSRPGSRATGGYGGGRTSPSAVGRTPSPDNSRREVYSSMSSRLTPSPEMSRRVVHSSMSHRSPSPEMPRHRSASPDYIPAVFPFPEPIPHCIPPRKPPKRPPLLPGASTDAADPPADQMPLTERSSRSKSRDREDANAWINEGERKKLEVYDPGFVQDHRRKADGWIKETTPQNIVLPRNKREGWLVQKKENEHRRRVRSTAIREMPTLPFDLWCIMKAEDEIEEKQSGYKLTKDAKDDRRQYYMSLGAKRKFKLYGGEKHAARQGSSFPKNALPRAPGYSAGSGDVKRQSISGSPKAGVDSP